MLCDDRVAEQVNAHQPRGSVARQRVGQSQSLQTMRPVVLVEMGAMGKVMVVRVRVVVIEVRAVVKEVKTVT